MQRNRPPARGTDVGAVRSVHDLPGAAGPGRAGGRADRVLRSDRSAAGARSSCHSRCARANQLGAEPHRVKESDGLRIDGGSMSHFDESTSLRLGQDADGLGRDRAPSGCRWPARAVRRTWWVRRCPSPSTAARRPQRGRCRGSLLDVAARRAGLDRGFVLRATVRARADRRSGRGTGPALSGSPFGLVSLPDGYGLSASRQGDRGIPRCTSAVSPPSVGLPDSDVVITYERSMTRVPTWSCDHRAGPAGAARRGPAGPLGVPRRAAALRLCAGVRGSTRSLPRPTRRDPRPDRGSRRPSASRPTWTTGRPGWRHRRAAVVTSPTPVAEGWVPARGR